MELFPRALCCRRLIFTFLYLLACNLIPQNSSASPSSAADLEKLEKLYLGVGSCASTVCHGGSKKSAGTVLQNEYRTWFRHDAHSKAFETLLSNDSKIIASHLGISAPEKDPECLQCHSTYVSPDQRGEKFRLTDGVGCESCHGAAGKYIKSHTARDRSHEDNINDGLTDLVAPENRSRICLDCHQGNGNKRVDHRLIGSGHPRLSFELDTYSANLPMHWEHDKDYNDRKEEYIPARHWAVGQAERAKIMLTGHLDFVDKMAKYGDKSLDKSFSDYYCYKCHHSLSDQQWKTRTYEGKPGEIHLNISSLVITYLIVKVLDSELADKLRERILALKNYATDKELSEIIKSLEGILDNKIIPLVSRTDYTEQTTRNLLRTVANFAAETPYLPYELAEQSVMALSTLSSQLSKLSAEDLHKKDLKSLLYPLRHEFDYKPENFTAAARKFQKKLIESKFNNE